MNQCYNLNEYLCSKHEGCLLVNGTCRKKNTSCGKLSEDDKYFIKLMKEQKTKFKSNLILYRIFTVFLFGGYPKIETIGKRIKMFFSSGENIKFLQNLLENETDINKYYQKLTDLNLITNPKIFNSLEEITFNKEAFSIFTVKLINSLNTDIKESDEDSNKEIIYYFIDLVKALIISSVDKKNYINNDLEKNVIVSKDFEDLKITSYNQIVKLFTDITPVKKDSASSSIILKAKFAQPLDKKYTSSHLIKPNSIFYFKIFNNDTNLHGGVKYIIENSQMLTELNMYNELFKLVEYNITPNIITKLITGTLPNFNTLEKAIDPKYLPLLEEEIQKINRSYRLPEKTKWESTGVIITNPGDSVFNTELPKLSNSEQKMILFQLFYTLYIFEKLKISHGDLHTGNLFINNIEPTDYIFIVEGIKYKLRINKLLKIYDFDHSSIMETTHLSDGKTINQISNVIRESTSTYCRHYSECNIFNPKLDISILTWAIMNYDLRKKIHKDTRDFLEDIFNNFFNSTETIKDTFNKLLVDKDNLREFNRINDFPLDYPYSRRLTDYNIPNETINLTWQQYQNEIKNNYGRICKNPNPTLNNQLWIPDTIIPNNKTILQHNYFHVFLMKADEKILPGQKVFTLDNRILK